MIDLDAAMLTMSWIRTVWADGSMDFDIGGMRNPPAAFNCVLA